MKHWGGGEITPYITGTWKTDGTDSLQLMKPIVPLGLLFSKMVIAFLL